MRKRRIFLGILLVIALMAFVACSNNDGTVLDPDTPDTVTDNNGNDLLDKDANDVKNDADDALDNAGDSVKDLVTSDSAINDYNNNDQ